jgi:ribosomal protein S18 acetylase RimI-like enzyme
VVVADPTAELLALVTATGDPPPATVVGAPLRRAELIRRRFGLALPPPFVTVAAGDPATTVPVRPAVATDGAAIAAVKWRAFGTNYRGGVLPDAFLDGRDVVPPASFWVGRAMLPPTRRHRLWVWGRPGTVLGYADTGPVREGERATVDRPDADATAEADADATADVDVVGEIYEIYVDPAAQGRGGGSALLAAAEAGFAAVGFVTAELSTLTTNRAAQAFYEGRGWIATGAVEHVDLGVVAFDEARYARRLAPGRS